MMKGLMKKVRGNKKGFTLAELLVVVAIVGILVAISIPVFTAQLSKARKATNQANMRAAKAAAVAQYLTDSAKIEYDYDISTGQATVVTGNKKATTEKTLDDVDGKEKYDLFSVSIEPSKNGTASTDKDAINGAIIKLYVGKQ